MKITLLTIGKTEDSYLKEGIEKYLRRLKHYVSFKVQELPELKNTKSLSADQQKAKEAELIHKHIASTDQLILLDEKGKEFSSVQFSGFLNKKMLGSVQHMVFVVGGPYGFGPGIQNRAGDKISLSKMTSISASGVTSNSNFNSNPL